MFLAAWWMVPECNTLSSRRALFWVPGAHELVSTFILSLPATLSVFPSLASSTGTEAQVGPGRGEKVSPGKSK